MENAVLVTRQRGEGAQGNEQQTLNMQISSIAAYAAQMNLRIIEVAKTGISARELYGMLLSCLDDHPDVRAIITHSLDRLVRSTDDRIALHAVLDERKIKLFMACPPCAPIGYSSVQFESGVRGILPDEQSLEAMRKLFMRYGTRNYSLRQMAEWARETKLPLSKRGRDIYKSTIHEIPRNPTCAHTGVIPRNLWERVQSTIAQRSPLRLHRKR